MAYKNDSSYSFAEFLIKNYENALKLLMLLLKLEKII